LDEGLVYCVDVGNEEELHSTEELYNPLTHDDWRGSNLPIQLFPLDLENTLSRPDLNFCHQIPPTVEPYQ